MQLWDLFSIAKDTKNTEKNLLKRYVLLFLMLRVTGTLYRRFVSLFGVLDFAREPLVVNRFYWVALGLYLY